MSVRTKKRSYEGEDITVTYDIKRCIHAAECVRGLPAVFNTDNRPWVQPDAASADEVMGVVIRCPSGALHFERKDGGPTETAPETNMATPDVNGPLYLYGDIEIQDSDGNIILTDTRVALCRCGASENKPLCDGAHEKIDFTDDGTLQENGLGGDSDASGSKLVIRSATNGPMLIQGAVTVQGHDEETAFTGNRGAFCRCGGSANKPFCDGTHTRIDFEAA